MKSVGKLICCFMMYLFLYSQLALADVGFTKEDLELVKSCLAGSRYGLTAEANGSISVKNHDGRGSLSVDKKMVTTFDSPDGSKRDEFNKFVEIRSCIRSHLKNLQKK